ncbi:MAG: AAA family ATPase [Nitrospirae bacterium]|nr:AAA family ATPase [Nitrospirota bacterium]
MEEIQEIALLFIKSVLLFILFFFSITVLRSFLHSLMGAPPLVYSQRRYTLRVRLFTFYSKLPFLFIFAGLIGAAYWIFYTIFFCVNQRHYGEVVLMAVVPAIYLYYWASFSKITSIFRGATGTASAGTTQVGFAAIGGYEQVKKQLREAVKSALSRNPLKTNGILLYGPQGCGKTFIAEKTAEELGIRYKKVHIDDIKSMWINESPMKLGDLFREAIARQPYALIFDEMDDLITSRDDRHFADSEDTKVTSAFLTYMDDLRKGNHRVVVFGTTNNYDKLDKASIRKGRFDYHVKINRPCKEDVKEIIKLKISGLVKSWSFKSMRRVNLINSILNWLLFIPFLIFLLLIGYFLFCEPRIRIALPEHIANLPSFLVILTVVAVPVVLLLGKKLIIGSIRKIIEKTKGSKFKKAIEGKELDRLAEHFEGRSAGEIDNAINMALPAGMNNLTADTIISINKENKKLSRNAVPDVSWDDVIINSSTLEEVKKICDFIKSYKTAKEKFTKPLKGMILYGEAGTGKTLIAKAIASNADCSFYHLKISEIQDKYRGGTEKNIQRIYEIARSNAPSVIFIDEADALFGKRESSKDNSATNQILGEMEGFEEYHDVVFTILATNCIDRIDPAVKSRMAYMLHIPKPDRESRERLFKLFISKVLHSGEFDYGYLAAITDGFSARDVENLINKAATMGVNRPLEYRDIPDTIEKEKGMEKPLTGKHTWDDLIVSGEVLKHLRAIENIFKYPEKAMAMGINSGIHALFYGEPGTGKTHAARIFAGMVNADFREYSGGEFRKKLVGETEEMIRDIFSWLRSRPAAVVFIDEADGILADRNSLSSEHSVSCVNQFLSELQGFEESSRSYAVIISTNRPEKLDSAVRSRFPIQVYFGLPGVVERERLLSLYLSGARMEGVDTGWLVNETEGRSGRDLVNIINGAKINALSENRDFLTKEDFKISLSTQRVEEKVR